MKKLMLLPKIKSSLAALILACTLTPSSSFAWDFVDDLVFGFAFGFGGSGVDEDIQNESGTGTVTASSSLDPGMLGISVEKFINDKWSLALSHRRGFQLGPFGMDVGFTGLVARRYFMRSPTFLPKKDLKNSVTLQRWVPFAGLGIGVASGSIDREGDAVPQVSGSGVYMGVHLGVDYHLYTNMILRPEFFTSATFADDSQTPATLNEYGLVVHFLFRL
jgi:hypothetical protein